jgi:hypothetical protein
MIMKCQNNFFKKLSILDLYVNFNLEKLLPQN